jgi:hypothetical protein
MFLRGMIRSNDDNVIIAKRCDGTLIGKLVSRFGDDGLEEFVRETIDTGKNIF